MATKSPYIGAGQTREPENGATKSSDPPRGERARLTGLQTLVPLTVPRRGANTNEVPNDSVGHGCLPSSI